MKIHRRTFLLLPLLIVLATADIAAQTGLIYRGPGVVKEILSGLRRLLERDGFDNVSQAVGAEFTSIS
jgi:dihydroorotate dehydrogenase